MAKGADRQLIAELSKISDAELRRLEHAANEVLERLEELARLNTTPVGQMLGGTRNFTEDTHYPAGDIHDAKTGSQYYYHAHRGSETENGHFHLFVRASAIPAQMTPAFPSYAMGRPIGDNAIAHLFAVSIGHDSLPFKLFTTNQWVTGETFYSAGDTEKLAAKFRMASDRARQETSRWISALVVLFRPQIAWLLAERDRRINAWSRQHPSRDVLKDEELEITSELVIDIDEQVARIDAEVARRKKSRRQQKPKADA